MRLSSGHSLNFANSLGDGFAGFPKVFGSAAKNRSCEFILSERVHGMHETREALIEVAAYFIRIAMMKIAGNPQVLIQRGNPPQPILPIVEPHQDQRRDSSRNCNSQDEGNHGRSGEFHGDLAYGHRLDLIKLESFCAGSHNALPRPTICERTKESP